MAHKKSQIRRGSFGRGLAVSLAGIRAGGAFAIDGALQKLRAGNAADAALDSPFARREARRFVAELGRLKGSYVKIGQMLALLGEHFLPTALTQALHELESATEPLPWSEIQPLLQAELGGLLAELEVEHQALAAASLSQVHRAIVKSSGEQICLKIQYPGLAPMIDSDFDAVVRMLLLARWVSAGRDLDDWLESLREQLHHEIDYLREAQMSDRVACLIDELPASPMVEVRYKVPQRYPRYCTGAVLAMEYVVGHVVTQAEVAQLSQARRNALGRSMLELFFYELYAWGVLQTDPNFGNYLLCVDRPPDQLVLLDFGSTVSPDDQFLLHLGNAIAAGQAQHRDALVASLIGLGCLRQDSSEAARRSFCDFCLQLLEPLRAPDDLPAQFLNAQGEYCWGTSRLLRRVSRQAAASVTSGHFVPPSQEFSMIARKLTGVFTFIAVLNAEFNAYDLVTQHVDRWREQG